jgi:hypothetical protein
MGPGVIVEKGDLRHDPVFPGTTFQRFVELVEAGDQPLVILIDRAMPGCEGGVPLNHRALIVTMLASL